MEQVYEQPVIVFDTSWMDLDCESYSVMFDYTHLNPETKLEMLIHENASEVMIGDVSYSINKVN